MKIFKKRIIHTKKYDIRRIFMFNSPLFQYIKIRKHGKKYKIYSFVKPQKPKENQRIFYLKVHRVHRTSLDCIRQWVNIADKMHAFIYFICDNSKMYDEIIDKICLPNKNFKFIKSDRLTMKSYIKKMLDKVERQNLWERIAYSMLTPFIHANKNKYLLSYNIDADDIILCIKPEKIAQAFTQVEKYALTNNIDLFNIDMFYSKSYGVHWSFGVVLCTNPQKCLDVVRKNTNWRENSDLIKKYNICWIDKFNFNVDWLFTFLRDTKQLNMKSFYINNGVVVHMPDIILEHGWAFMLKWQNQKVSFPILQEFYCRKIWETIKIPPDCINIDVDLKEDDYKTFLSDFYDFGIGFELDMLNYAKSRNLIEDSIYEQYSNTQRFIREQNLRKKIEVQHKNRIND